ncbi:unnamed protein product [Sphagnum balticum]
MLPSGDYALKRRGNVVRLLSWREVTPVTRRPSYRLWHKAAAVPNLNSKPLMPSGPSFHDSLRHCTAKYCTLEPAPRSTIAAAFSPDGNTLASTQYFSLFLFFSSAEVWDMSKTSPVFPLNSFAFKFIQCFSLFPSSYLFDASPFLALLCFSFSLYLCSSLLGFLIFSSLLGFG